MKLLKGVCWIVAQGNDLLLYGSNGEELPAQCSITATADMEDGVATANVSFVCNVAGSREEMMQRIAELEKSKSDIEIDDKHFTFVRDKLKVNAFTAWLKDVVSKL